MAQNLVQLDDHLYQAISHNPEAVGSSPTSATKKTPDFTTKSGVFLLFSRFWTFKKSPCSLFVQVPSRVMRKLVCSLWLNEVSRQ